MAGSAGVRNGGSEELAIAVGQYALGEISLGKAAERVGISRWKFEEFLQEIGFISLYGPRTPGELEDEIDAALDSCPDDA